MDGAHACGRQSIKVVARCGNEETFGNTRVHNLTRHHPTRGRSSWTLNLYPSPLRLKLMCCKRQTLKKRTHTARVADEILVETSGLRKGCWVQLNAIAVAKPLSLFVETHGTEQGLTADEITNVLQGRWSQSRTSCRLPNSPRAEDFSRCPSWTLDNSLVCHAHPPTDGQVCGEERHERTVLGAVVA